MERKTWIAIGIAALAVVATLVFRSRMDYSTSQMRILSPAFAEGGTIPTTHSCEGGSVIPPLVFEGIPSGTQSLALIVEDPDTARGTFVHWVVYNLNPDTQGIEAGITPPDAFNGFNGSGKVGYIGPCPPTGSHRYFFRLYALDRIIDTSPGSLTAGELRGAMADHILAEAETMGRYEKVQ